MTSCFRIPSAPHLRLFLNPEILNVARATPRISLNRKSQICGTSGRVNREVIFERAQRVNCCGGFVCGRFRGESARGDGRFAAWAGDQPTLEKQAFLPSLESPAPGLPAADRTTGPQSPEGAPDPLFCERGRARVSLSQERRISWGH